MTAVLVLAGGAAGALVRFYAERWAVHHFHERVPWGTAIVNLAGALLLGIVAGLTSRGVLSQDVLVLLGAGFCGALTTFSGFMGQVESRWRHAHTRSLALRYLVGVNVAGIALAVASYRLVS